FELGEVTKFEQINRDLMAITLEAKKFDRFPSTGGIEKFLSFIGASSGNELSSAYNVKGGNYDENLVYINDIEVYRPFLVRAGQQEGLSIINPDMVDRLIFSTGGFEARYGDKLSSVLDINYKIPRYFETSIRGSLLGTSITVANQSKNQRFSYLIGARYRSNQLLFNSLDVSGDYRPLNVDFQSLIRYKFNSSLSLSWLGSMAYNRYELLPSGRQTSFGTVTSALRLNVNFGGLDKMEYRVALNGLTFHYTPNKNTSIKWINSYFTTTENEHNTTEGAYGLYELENNLGSDNLGKERALLGVGYFIQNARNDLQAKVFNSGIVATQKTQKSTWYYGIKYQNEKIHDWLNEWQYNDSGGHNIALDRQNGKQIILDNRVKAENTVHSFRVSGYVQNSYLINKNKNLRLNSGVRHQYWSLNGQNMISPRLSISYEPNKKFNDTLYRKLKTQTAFDSLKKRDVLFKFATGVYYQPPFYREFRRLDGTLNTDIKAQRSIHFVLGSDLNFKAWGRPFKLINELYYKHLDNLIPYYIDNVRIRYYAQNSSKGYATGFDTRINGEFIKGLESWLSFSLLQTRENITYVNGAGESVESGFIRRPTDQRVNFSILFADELPIDKTYKMNLGLVFGSRVPYYFDGNNRYIKTPNTIPPYRRVDIGFSKEIIGGLAKPSQKFKRIESLWASVEVFNLLEFNNTVSYIWVKDVSNRTYGVPNYLTGRRLNIKFILKIK
ncbi:MAG: TonB-dependent receptor plug domain-containing protein, partial [Bacteroidia bacterium]